MYGKSSQEIQRALQQYIRDDEFRSRQFGGELGAEAREVHVLPAGRIEWEMSLADLLAALRRNDEAVKRYEILARSEPKNWEVAQALGQLALRKGDRKMAQDYFQRAKDLGGDNPRLSGLLETVSLDLKKEETRQALERSLNAKVQRFGPDHPEIVVRLKQLATFSRENGDDTAAEEYFKRALSLQERVLGRKNLDVAKTCEEIARFYKVGKRYNEFEVYLLRALSIRTSLLGESDPSVAGDLIELGLLFESGKRNGRAVELFRRVLAILENLPGTDPSEMALSLEYQAWILQKLGRGPEAEPFRIRAFAIRAENVKLLSSKLAGMSDRQSSAKPQEIYRVGPDVTEPVPLSSPRPSYTEEARLARCGGVMLLDAVIEPDGGVDNIVLVKDLGFGLDERSAEMVLKQWRFSPATRDGKPVAVRVTIEITFRLY